MLHNYIASEISTQVHLIPKVVLLAVHRGQMYRLVFFWFPVIEIATQICQTIKETFWLTTEKPSSKVDIRQGLLMAPIRFLWFSPFIVSLYNQLQSSGCFSHEWEMIASIQGYMLSFFKLKERKHHFSEADWWTRSLNFALICPTCYFDKVGACAEWHRPELLPIPKQWQRHVWPGGR